jgi:HD-like signal output (HDOD) protein
VIKYLCRTEEYFKLLDEKRALSLSLEEAEKKVFGFDHQKLGAEVLKCWGIPDSIYESIRYHHRYRDISKKLQSDSNLLLLSDKMSSVYHETRSAEKFQENEISPRQAVEYHVFRI